MKKLFLPTLCLLILTVTISHASDLQLPATGQTISQATGDDGAVQAGKPWPAPRFTDNRNGTIRDDLTGLLWSADANLLAAGSAVANSDGVVAWQGALDEIKRLNANAYLGFSDWRLPNLNELASLVHQGEPVQSRWLNRQGFSNTNASNYWSSSSVAREADRAWTVHLDSGSVGSLRKSGVAHVWPVRGASGLLPATGQSVCYDIAGLKAECSGTGQDGELRMGSLWPALRFSDNGDDTISDNLTGLVWPKNASPALAARITPAAGGPALWPDALEFVASLNSSTYLGYDDWRLPNRNELVSLVNYAETTPGVQLSMAGAEGVQERYWSSGTSAADPSAAWDVATTGEVAERSKYDLRFGSYIWPVRGGIETQATSGTQSKKLSKTVAAAVPLSVTTATLPAGTIGITYSQTLAATGGTTPYTWSRKSGTLPVGLTLSTTGIISGKPTTAGTKTFIVQVKDKAAKTATKSLSITVSATPATPPSITTTIMNNGFVAVSYSQTLAATGGKTPYTWSKTIGSLPAGLTLSTTGVLSGTPTTAGTSNFTVQVKDGNNATATAALTITIVPAVSVTSSTLLSGSVGSSYNQTLTASGGKAPYSWSITSGILPSGLTLDTSTGAIIGTPTASGIATFTAQVKDSNNKIASGIMYVTINNPVSITTSALHDDYVGITYSTALSATGGTPPYTWMISEGSLPAGLSLDASTGAISGTPAVTGASNFTVQTRDAVNAISSRAYTVNITDFGSIHGSVTDQSTGAPIAGATVTLNLSGITSKNASDFVFTCNGAPITANNYGKISDNDDVKLGCTGRYYTSAKVRNPYGGTDPFTIRWNGLSAYSGGEYLAQSFKPTKSGMLNRVSFYFSDFSTPYGTQGSVTVLLKSSLGGDRSVYLANSAEKIITQGTLTGWVDFDFTAPVTVTAGQEYFIELQGDFATWKFTNGGAYFDTSVWGNGVQYPDGQSYRRSGGVWGPLDNSLAFRTYVDANPDITTTLPTQSIDIHGAAGYDPNLELTNFAAGVVESCYLDFSGKPMPYANSADYRCTKTVTNGDGYYDTNGWINIHLYSQSSYYSYPEMDTTLLVTDQFSLTFNRTLSTTTDATGAYSFAGLPDGNYSVTVSRPAYMPATSTGSLTPGQSINLASSLDKALPAILRGTVQHPNFGSIAGATVTLTDALGSDKSTIADSDGNYLINGIVNGSYSVAFAAPQLVSQTLTGTLSPGEVQTKNIWMTGAPVTLTVTSPADGALIPGDQLTVTGGTLNAETVTITATGNGVSNYYTVTPANGSFSVSIPLAAGQTALKALAKSKYYMQTTVNITVSRAPFTIKNLGDTGNVAVVELTGDFNAKNTDGSYNDQPRKAIATEYFKSHGDVDFLVYLSTFDYAMPEATAQGFYLPVKNDVQGINQALADITAAFGSAGKLQGTIDLGNATSLAANPFGTKLDETVTTLNHELMHRYGAYVRFKNPDGTLNTSLLGKDSAHWSYLFDSKGSLMYGNGWKDHGDGTFTSTAIRNAFSPLDLYLMGMIPKEQVPPMLLIDNPAIDKTKLPQLGATISGTAKTITIDDIVAAEGERIPNATTAQKKFNVGFVLLTRAGDNASAATQAIETLRSAWAGRLAEQTNGIGGINGIAPTVSVAIDSPAEGATITGPDVTVSGAVINSSGAETGVTVNGMPATITGNRFIVNHVPLQSGANSVSVTATDANGLTASTTCNVTTAPGNYIRISSNIESGTGPLEVNLRVDGNFAITAPTVNVTGPGGAATLTAVSATEYTANFVSEGTYTITVTATGPDGQVYSDNVMVTVISIYQLETLLKGKWEGLKAKIISGDISGAGAYFPQASREMFLSIFGDPTIDSVSRLNDVSAVKIYTSSDYYAQGGLIRQDEDGEFSYPITFSRDESGLWRIYNF